jgi:TonB family protein
MPEACWKGRTERRLVIALVGSAFVHVVLSEGLTQGLSVRTVSAVSSRSAVSVRLVPRASEPASAVVVVEERPPHRTRPVAPSRSPAETGAAVPSESAAASTEIGVEAADPTYYTARQLDVYPALGGALDFRVLPGDAREIAGRVLVRVDISATGTVDAVTIVEAEPPGYLEEDARRAFASAHFKPGLKNGRPVKSRILVQVDYGSSRSASP